MAKNRELVTAAVHDIADDGATLARAWDAGDVRTFNGMATQIRRALDDAEECFKEDLYRSAVSVPAR